MKNYFSTSKVLFLACFFTLACHPLKKTSEQVVKTTHLRVSPENYPYPVQKQAVGSSFMVVSAHPLATEVGHQILAKGGNAVDASVAVQMALAVVYPQAGNIGGGGFFIYRGKNGETDALDYREKAPTNAYERMYQDSLGNVVSGLSEKGHLASGVPGSVAGMWASHQKYGKMKWSDLIQPAVELAEKGFRITPQEANNLNEERRNFLIYNTVKPVFLSKSNWEAGDWLIQKDLSRTLIRIRDEGRDGFYKGATAALFAREMREGGGIINEGDLMNYEAIWRKPIQFEYKDYTVTSMPMPSSGGVLMQQMLGMIEDYPLKEYGFHSTKAIHLMTEVERRAYADRAKHMGDADFWPVPTAEMVHPDYIKKRMASFSWEKAGDTMTVKAGKFAYESDETTHLCVVDAEGNGVSVTTTLNYSYGSRVVVAGAGFILNNEMDDFSAKPGVPNLYGLVGGKANAVKANKRMLSSMTPTIIAKKDKLFMVVGSPGGSTIPTSVFQTFLNVAEFGLPLLDAVHNKRFHHQYLPDVLQYEEGAISTEQEIALKKMGHQLKQRGPIGRVEAILIRPDGKIEGVADNRGDDFAKGQ